MKNYIKALVLMLTCVGVFAAISLASVKANAAGPVDYINEYDLEAGYVCHTDYHDPNTISSGAFKKYFSVLDSQTVTKLSHDNAKTDVILDKAPSSGYVLLLLDTDDATKAYKAACNLNFKYKFGKNYDVVEDYLQLVRVTYNGKKYFEVYMTTDGPTNLSISHYSGTTSDVYATIGRAGLGNITWTISGSGSDSLVYIPYNYTLMYCLTDASGRDYYSVRVYAKAHEYKILDYEKNYTHTVMANCVYGGKKYSVSTSATYRKNKPLVIVKKDITNGSIPKGYTSSNYFEVMEMSTSYINVYLSEKAVEYWRIKYGEFFCPQKYRDAPGDYANKLIWGDNACLEDVCQFVLMARGYSMINLYNGATGSNYDTMPIPDGTQICFYVNCTKPYQASSVYRYIMRPKTISLKDGTKMAYGGKAYSGGNLLEIAKWSDAVGKGYWRIAMEQYANGGVNINIGETSTASAGYHFSGEYADKSKFTDIPGNTNTQKAPTNNTTKNSFTEPPKDSTKDWGAVVPKTDGANVKLK